MVCRGGFYKSIGRSHSQRLCLVRKDKIPLLVCFPSPMSFQPYPCSWCDEGRVVPMRPTCEQCEECETRYWSMILREHPLLPRLPILPWLLLPWLLFPRRRYARSHHLWCLLLASGSVFRTFTYSSGGALETFLPLKISSTES